MSEASELQDKIEVQQKALAAADLATIQALRVVVTDPKSTIMEVQQAFQVCMVSLGDPYRISTMQQIIDTYGQFGNSLATLESQANAAAGN